MGACFYGGSLIRLQSCVFVLWCLELTEVWGVRAQQLGHCPNTCGKGSRAISH